MTPHPCTHQLLFSITRSTQKSIKYRLLPCRLRAWLS